MTPPSQGDGDKRVIGPELQKAIDAGKVDGRGLPDLTKRVLRCGPWTEREDGALVCGKCGDVEYPGGGGPFGF